jgi:hypothetical protein
MVGGVAVAVVAVVVEALFGMRGWQWWRNRGGERKKWGQRWWQGKQWLAR